MALVNPAGFRSPELQDFAKMLFEMSKFQLCLVREAQPQAR